MNSSTSSNDSSSTTPASGGGETDRDAAVETIIQATLAYTRQLRLVLDAVHSANMDRTTLETAESEWCKWSRVIANTNLYALRTRIGELQAELAAERERREELEVVAAALYLGHDDAKNWFDMYKAVYLTPPSTGEGGKER